MRRAVRACLFVSLVCLFVDHTEQTNKIETTGNAKEPFVSELLLFFFSFLFPRLSLSAMHELMPYNVRARERERQRAREGNGTLDHGMTAAWREPTNTNDDERHA